MINGTQIIGEVANRQLNDRLDPFHRLRHYSCIKDQVMKCLDSYPIFSIVMFLNFHYYTDNLTTLVLNIKSMYIFFSNVLIRIKGTQKKYFPHICFSLLFRFMRVKVVGKNN